MKNNIKNISKVIYLLDNHILRILSKNEIDDKTLSTITSIRLDYVQELNNLISTKNTRDMFDKKYFESYRRSNLKINATVFNGGCLLIIVFMSS